jgi:hypothetical protein
MKKNFELMQPNVFEKAVIDHNKYLEENPHKRVICDATITPFCGAMKSLGFTTKTHSNGCSILRVCSNDICKSGNSTLYIKEDKEYWGCPHCRRISENQENPIRKQEIIRRIVEKNDSLSLDDEKDRETLITLLNEAL